MAWIKAATEIKKETTAASDAATGPTGTTEAMDAPASQAYTSTT